MEEDDQEVRARSKTASRPKELTKMSPSIETETSGGNRAAFTKSSSSNFDKLPRWARDLIIDLTREREVAVRALNEFRDEQTPSSIWHEKRICTGEAAGPVEHRRYLQAYRVSFYLGPAEYDVVDVCLRPNEQALQITAGHELLFQPQSGNSIRILRRSRA